VCEVEEPVVLRWTFLPPHVVAALQRLGAQDKRYRGLAIVFPEAGGWPAQRIVPVLDRAAGLETVLVATREQGDFRGRVDHTMSIPRNPRGRFINGAVVVRVWLLLYNL
jgi:hypothetical protein